MKSTVAPFVFAALAAVGVTSPAPAALPIVRPPLLINRGVLNQKGLAPRVKITSPLENVKVEATMLWPVG